MSSFIQGSITNSSSITTGASTSYVYVFVAVLPSAATALTVNLCVPTSVGNDTTAGFVVKVLSASPSQLYKNLLNVLFVTVAFNFNVVSVFFDDSSS